MEGFVDNLVYPSPVSMLGFLVMVAVDLWTGVQKAKKRNEATTSEGLRKTVTKSTTYCALLVSLLILFNLTTIATDKFLQLFDYSLNTVVGFCIWIEFKSVLENLIEINTDASGRRNFLCRQLLEPLHNITILKFK